MQHLSVPERSPVGAAVSPPLFLRLPAVIRTTGLCRSTIYRLISEKKFPNPVRLADRAVAWRQSDIDRWSDERVPSGH